MKRDKITNHALHKHSIPFMLVMIAIPRENTITEQNDSYVNKLLEWRKEVRTLLCL